MLQRSEEDVTASRRNRSSLGEKVGFKVSLREQLVFHQTEMQARVLHSQSRDLAKKQVGNRTVVFNERVMNIRIGVVYGPHCRNLLSARLEEFALISVGKK